MNTELTELTEALRNGRVEPADALRQAAFCTDNATSRLLEALERSISGGNSNIQKERDDALEWLRRIKELSEPDEDTRGPGEDEDEDFDWEALCNRLIDRLDTINQLAA